MDKNAKILFDYLNDLIYDPANAQLDLNLLSEDFTELGKGMIFFASNVTAATELAKSLSQGDLNVQLPPPDNEFAAPLKSLHAALKHLTWQTQQIAKGDYNHRIDYLGEFSQAFNSMVEKLKAQEAVQKKYVYDLQKTAYIDKLTRLYNRHFGMDTLNEWLKNKMSFVLCFVDIDNLKYVNDKFGHWEGDKYITCVSDALNDFFPGEVISRIGGDEFMLLLKEWSLDDAGEKFESIRNFLLISGTDPNNYIKSISYGLVFIDQTNQLSAGDILRFADEKMYIYKRGKSKTTFGALRA